MGEVDGAVAEVGGGVKYQADRPVVLRKAIKLQRPRTSLFDSYPTTN